MNPYKDFDNYLKELPTADGYFGEWTLEGTPKLGGR